MPRHTIVRREDREVVDSSEYLERLVPRINQADTACKDAWQKVEEVWKLHQEVILPDGERVPEMLNDQISEAFQAAGKAMTTIASLKRLLAFMLDIESDEEEESP
jgi:hypothetical protein